jgi:hypothetical protein
VKAAKKLLDVPTIGGGVPGQGAPQLAEIHKYGAENGQFPPLLGLKITINAVFRLKST